MQSQNTKYSRVEIAALSFSGIPECDQPTQRHLCCARPLSFVTRGICGKDIFPVKNQKQNIYISVPFIANSWGGLGFLFIDL